MRWKIRGVGWEDKLFKVCDAESPRPGRRYQYQRGSADRGSGQGR